MDATEVDKLYEEFQCEMQRIGLQGLKYFPEQSEGTPGKLQYRASAAVFDHDVRFSTDGNTAVKYLHVYDAPNRKAAMTELKVKMMSHFLHVSGFGISLPYLP